MVRPMPRSFSGSITSLLAFAVLLQTATAIVADFSLYPSGAQSCLSSAATSSKCDQSTVAKFNACVCSNGGGFIDSAAKCIGKDSSKDLTTTYTVLSRNCGDSNTPVDYSLDKFLAQGSATTAAGTATTRTVSSLVTITQSGSTRVSTSLSTVTTSVAPAPVVSTITVATTNAAGQTTGVLSVVTFAPLQSVTNAPSASTSSAAASSTSSSSSGLSTGAAVGIGVGVGVPIVLALCALVGVLIWRGKKKDRAAAGAGVGTGSGEKGYNPHEIDGSSAAASQSHSPYAPPYAQPVGAAAYKTSPHTPNTPYDGTALPQYGGHEQPHQLRPVELSGTPLYEPQELPGSFAHPQPQTKP